MSTRRLMSAAETVAQLEAEADAEARADLQVFTLLHPTWREYETLMVRYSELVPRGALSWPLYLEVLFFLSTRLVYESTKTVRVQ